MRSSVAPSGVSSWGLAWNVWRTSLVVVVVAMASGCGGSGPASSPPTQLTIVKESGPTTGVLRSSTATLVCDGTASATGFLRGVAENACAFVRGGVITQVAANRRSRGLCAQVYGGPQHAHITGTAEGQRVDLTVTRTDSCGAADWQTLEPLLGDPQQQGGPDATPPTAATSTTTPPIAYLVKPGDTLTSIAKQFGVPAATIAAFNQLADPDHLVAGQTLLVPQVPAVQLLITPSGAPPGTRFELKLTGARPSESITFEIDSPNVKFTGPAHPASADGVVTTTYQSSASDPPGTYNVVAKGDQGTTAQATFRVDPRAPVRSSRRGSRPLSPTHGTGLLHDHHADHTISTAAPVTRSAARSSSAWSAESRSYRLVVTFSARRPASARNSSPSARVLAVTLRTWRSMKRCCS
jgi:LysM repeat protein